MITGDIPASTKARMSNEELAKAAIEEESALDTLAAYYPEKVHGYVYRELLQNTLKKDCIEALLVSYADKMDAICESLHEVLAGNFLLLRSFMFYINTLTLFPAKFPELKEFLKNKESSWTNLMNTTYPYEVKQSRFTELNKPHTSSSVAFETDFLFYNAWKKLILKRNPEEGIDWLAKQKEFFIKP